MNGSIILIGPVGAGKSTQGKLIAKALNKRLVSLDRIAEDYYSANGFGDSRFRKIEKEKGFLAAYRQWCPSLAYAAQQVVLEYPDCVIDFGAGHSHYEDDALFRVVKEALSGCQNVILLLPTEDLDRSVSLLKERSINQRNTDWIREKYDFIEHWVKDDCNHNLATETIYTDGKTAEQTCAEILKAIGADSGPAPGVKSTEEWIAEINVHELEQRMSPILHIVANSLLEGDYKTFQMHHYPVVSKMEFKEVASALRPYGKLVDVKYLGHLVKSERIKLLWKVAFSNSKEELLCDFNIELHGNDERIVGMGIDL